MFYEYWRQLIQRQTGNECKGKLMKLIQITAAEELLFFIVVCYFAFCLPWNDNMSRVYARRTSDIFPEEAQYLWTHFWNIHATYFSTGCCHTTPIELRATFLWSWLHRTYTVTAGLSFNSTERSSAKPANDTSRVCRYPVADCALSPLHKSGCQCSFFAALLKITGQKYETNKTATSYRSYARTKT